MKHPKSILITGASSGIGEALAKAYAAPGIFLAITGRNEKRLAIVTQELKDLGADVEAAPIDSADREAMAHWMEKIWADHPLDLVIANAGISGGSGGHENGEPVSQARKIFDVNLHGVMNTIEPVLQPMIERGYGQIALMSSLAAFRGWPGAPSYSASKGAVRFYGEALRGSMHHTGVHINVICPGFVVSRMTNINDYKMPFLMPAGKAAQIIKNGLEKNKGRIAFPMPTHFLAWIISVFPDVIMQKFLRQLPQKT